MSTTLAKQFEQKENIHDQFAGKLYAVKGRPRRSSVPRPFAHDEQRPVKNFVPLEEHFENFGDVAGEVSENFFKGLKKILNRRAEIKDKKKLAKADVIQAKADAERIRANSEAQVAQMEAQARIAAAQQQAAQMNTLASATGNPLVTPQQTPMYQTLQDTSMNSQGGNWQTVTEEIPLNDSAALPGKIAGSTIDTTVTPAKAKKNKTIIIAIVAIVLIAGAWYFMKKKK